MNVNALDARQPGLHSSTHRGEKFDAQLAQENQAMRARATEIDHKYGAAYNKEAYTVYAHKLHEALYDIQNPRSVRKDFPLEYEVLLPVYSKYKDGEKLINRVSVNHEPPVIIVALDLFSSINQLEFHREPIRNNLRVTNGIVHIQDPRIMPMEEEFLHASEEIVRGGFQYYPNRDEMDPLVREALSVTVHAETMVDAALTLASIDMGNDVFLDLAGRSKGQTALDGLNMAKRSRSQFGTILGLPLNERFQYPSVTKGYLELVTKTVSDDMDKLNLVVNKEGHVVANTNALQLFELFALAYGEEQLPIVLRLLDSQSVEDQITFAKFLIQSAKSQTDGPAIANLVRHHKPLSATFRKDILSYDVPDDIVESLTAPYRKHLPAIVTIVDLRHITS